jgi:hypothetical protein
LGIFILISILILNIEILRSYAAIKLQSGVAEVAVVDWPLIGMLGHAIGMHGGAWDVGQWGLTKNALEAQFIFGAFATLSILIFTSIKSQTIKKTMILTRYLPLLVIVGLLLIGIFYFRFCVPNNLAGGVGRSWSQFKLAEWVYPFAMVFIELAILNSLVNLKKYFNTTIILIFLLFLGATLKLSTDRVAPLISYYGKNTRLDKYYENFVQVIAENCPIGAPIYIALGGEHHKFRQMLAYLLPNKKILSNWSDDNYISLYLMDDVRIQVPMPGQCIVELADGPSIVKNGSIFEKFRVGVYDSSSRVVIESAINDYGREADGENWWYWVKSQIVFNLKSHIYDAVNGKSKISFEYHLISGKSLKIIIETSSGKEIYFNAEGSNSNIDSFDRVIDMPIGELKSVKIISDGNPVILGERDSRIATLMIRNLRISSVVQ